MLNLLTTIWLHIDYIYFQFEEEEEGDDDDDDEDYDEDEDPDFTPNQVIIAFLFKALLWTEYCIVFGMLMHVNLSFGRQFDCVVILDSLHELHLFRSLTWQTCYQALLDNANKLCLQFILSVIKYYCKEWQDNARPLELCK